MRKMKLVMVGNGMAGVRKLEEMLKISPDLYEITVFGFYFNANSGSYCCSSVSYCKS